MTPPRIPRVLANRKASPWWVGAALVAILIFRLLPPGTGGVDVDPLIGLSARCVRVIDGDTLDVESANGRMRIRMIGIDAMDSHRAEKVAAQAKEHGVTERAVRGLSAHATSVLRDRLMGRTVRLFPDPDREDRDSYGRYLRYVELDGKDIGEEMLALGLAEPRRNPHARAEVYHKAARPLDWGSSALP